MTTPSPVPAPAVYTVPNVLQLAEHHRTLDAGLTDNFGKVTETLKATFDWVANVDTRYYEKYPVSTSFRTAGSGTRSSLSPWIISPPQGHGARKPKS